jgi:hypothetical protein
MVFALIAWEVASSYLVDAFLEVASKNLVGEVMDYQIHQLEEVPTLQKEVSSYLEEASYLGVEPYLVVASSYNLEEVLP